jgi:hypothetical protein
MEGRPSSGWLLLTGAAVGSALSLGLTWAWMPRKNGTDVDNECHRLRVRDVSANNGYTRHRAIFTKLAPK